ncbi:hypothetical protein G9A89_006796 [Geosiphon pyriformis]|nr:hypothetical protein G9A89_006796 [Geosiphon pyriformis]
MTTYSNRSIKELKSLCQERGLATNGKKMILVERLNQYDQEFLSRQDHEQKVHQVIQQQEPEDEEQTSTASGSELSTPKLIEVSNTGLETAQELKFEEKSVATPAAISELSPSLSQIDINESENNSIREILTPRPETETLSSPIVPYRISSPPLHQQDLKEQPGSNQSFYPVLEPMIIDQDFVPDSARIVIDRKELTNPLPEVLDPKSKFPNEQKASTITLAQCYYSRAFQYWGYDQLQDMAANRFIYLDGEVPWWMADNYDTAASIMKLPGLQEENIFGEDSYGV